MTHANRFEIPYAFFDCTNDQVGEAFASNLSIGALTIECEIKRDRRTGNRFKRFIIYTEQCKQSANLQTRIETNGYVKLMYNETFYWKIVC